MKKTIIVFSLIVAIPIFSIFSLFLYSLKLDLSMKETLRYYTQNYGEKKIFVATDKTCSIETPFDWMKIFPKGKYTIIDIGDSRYNDEYMEIYSYKKEDLSLDEATDIVIGFFKKSVKSPTIRERKRITINNSKAEMILSDGILDDNKKWAFTVYVIDKKDAFYQFTCFTTPSNSNYANKIFREIVESFKVFPKKNTQQQLEPMH